MTRLILRALNPAGVILLLILGVSLQTSLFTSWPLQYFQPDIVLVTVIWVAMRRSFTEGGIITIIGADIAELHSAVPQGVFLIAYMAVYLGVRLTSRILVIPNLSSYVLVTLFASIGWKLVGLGTLHLLGVSANQWRHTLFLLFPGAVVEGAFSVWFYKQMDRYDIVTFKNARAGQALEEELQLEGEGF